MSCNRQQRDELVSAMNTKKINYIKNVSNLRFNVVGVFGDPYGCNHKLDLKINKKKLKF